MDVGVGTQRVTRALDRWDEKGCREIDAVFVQISRFLI